MGRFVIGRDESGKAVYQYVYGNTYNEAYKKVQIGMEVESRFQSGKCISVSEVYQEWITAIANRVRESSYANYRNKFEKRSSLQNISRHLKVMMTATFFLGAKR